MATTLRPDQTLYPSPRLAREAPVETLAYMVTYDPSARQPDALLTTNTSSIPVTQVASGVPVPERVVGMHFFNPAPIMKLVEIVKTVVTDDEVVADVEAPIVNGPEPTPENVPTKVAEVGFITWPVEP